jgi:hypothetical protein
MRFATKILRAFLSLRIYTARSAQLVIIELFTQKCPFSEILRKSFLPSFTQVFIFLRMLYTDHTCNAFPASYKRTFLHHHKTSHLMLSREIIVAHCENGMKSTNIVHEQNAEICSAKVYSTMIKLTLFCVLLA